MGRRDRRFAAQAGDGGERLALLPGRAGGLLELVVARHALQLVAPCAGGVHDRGQLGRHDDRVVVGRQLAVGGVLCVVADALGALDGDALARLADVGEDLARVGLAPAVGVVDLDGVERAGEEVDAGAVVEEVVGVFVHDPEVRGATQAEVTRVEAHHFDGQLAELVGDELEHLAGDPLVGQEEVRTATDFGGLREF